MNFCCSTATENVGKERLVCHFGPYFHLELLKERIQIYSQLKEIERERERLEKLEVVKSL